MAGGALMRCSVKEPDHEDVDIVIELDWIDEVLRAIEPLGFRLVEDYLPTRAMLRSSMPR